MISLERLKEEMSALSILENEYESLMEKIKVANKNGFAAPYLEQTANAIAIAMTALNKDISKEYTDLIKKPCTDCDTGWAAIGSDNHFESCETQCIRLLKWEERAEQLLKIDVLNRGSQHDK